MAGESLVITFNYQDFDKEDSLTIVGEELPLGMTVNFENKLLIEPLDNSYSGEFVVKILVWDDDSIGAGQSFSASQSFIVKVTMNPSLEGYVD